MRTIHVKGKPWKFVVGATVVKLVAPNGTRFLVPKNDLLAPVGKPKYRRILDQEPEQPLGVTPSVLKQYITKNLES